MTAAERTGPERPLPSEYKRQDQQAGHEHQKKQDRNLGPHIMPDIHLDLLARNRTAATLVRPDHTSVACTRIVGARLDYDLAFSYLAARDPGRRGRPRVKAGWPFRLASIPGSVASPQRRQRHPLTVPEYDKSLIQTVTISPSQREQCIKSPFAQHYNTRLKVCAHNVQA